MQSEMNEKKTPKNVNFSISSIVRQKQILSSQQILSQKSEKKKHAQNKRNIQQ